MEQTNTDAAVKARFLVCKEDEILHTVSTLPIAMGVLEALKKFGQDTDGVTVQKVQQVYPAPPKQRRGRKAKDEN